MAAGGQGSTVSPPSQWGSEGKASKNFDFFPLKLGKTTFVKVKIQ